MKQIDDLKKLISIFDKNQEYTLLSENEIAHAESRLTIQFPALLRNFYRELGDYPLFKNQGAYCFDLVPLSELSFYENDNDEELIIFIEGMGYESIWESIRKSELTASEPQSEFWVVDAMQEKHHLFDGLCNVIISNILSKFEQRCSFKIAALSEDSLKKLNLEKLPEKTLSAFCYGNQDMFLVWNPEQHQIDIDVSMIKTLQTVLLEFHAIQYNEVVLCIDNIEVVDISSIFWFKENIENKLIKLFIDGQIVDLNTALKLFNQ